MNKKNSLLHYEGLANLIASESENQRIIASKQTFGESENICKIWRNTLLESIAVLDAAIDFTEENESFNVDQIRKNLSLYFHKALVDQLFESHPLLYLYIDLFFLLIFLF